MRRVTLALAASMASFASILPWSRLGPLTQRGFAVSTPRSGLFFTAEAMIRGTLLLVSGVLIVIFMYRSTRKGAA